MSQELLTILTQFGAAGLIGFMWIAERKQAAARERQLSEAHLRLLAQGHELEALLNVIKENTKAIVSLEHTQRTLIELAAGMSAGSGRSLTEAA
ncbi:MAG: hypothetical protein L0Y44_12765 [Phycisphaerales bacterium]|nr:hypothetical protein [Phycisphaerales bacterium]MCI0674714.1 hypothetical protein [Phycisphaerales bacterium]